MSHSKLLAELLATLDLEELGSAKASIQASELSAGVEEVPDIFAGSFTVFRGQSQKMPHNRVFGGQVLAQCVVACGRTVSVPEGSPHRRLHSLHAYFMRPGDDTQPINFAVERMRDGRSYSTRRVHAMQFGKPILSMSASFQDPAGGLEHQDQMPQVPPPAEVPVPSGTPEARISSVLPVDLRRVEDFPNTVFGDSQRADSMVWTRAIGPLPDDPLVHDAVLAYASDYSLLESAMLRHGRRTGEPGTSVASLDHAMWFHRPARADEWILYAQNSPSAQSSRGLAVGRMFTKDGTLVATVAQEGMMRFRDLP